MQSVLEKISSAVWGTPLIMLLLGTGIFYTLKLRFIQLRLPRLLLRTKSSGRGQLKTVCMSLGASMGTGNIAGTASALAIGGAGSLLWMWVSAFFGISTKACEIIIGQRYREHYKESMDEYIDQIVDADLSSMDQNSLLLEDLNPN